MIRLWVISFCATLLALVGVSAEASQCEAILHCSFGPKPITHFDRPAKQTADCSYKNAGDEFSYTASGNAAVDIGGGLVGQRRIHEGCTRIEMVYIADCFSGQIVNVRGLCPADEQQAKKLGVNVFDEVADLLFPPLGELYLTSSTTLADIRQMSEQNRYSLTEIDGDGNSMTRRRNRVDHFCGCKRFYPNSGGALK